MSKNPEKDFGPIAADYAFFASQATEAEQDARAYVQQIGKFVPAKGMVRMLDFGCGSGTFTERLLKQIEVELRNLSHDLRPTVLDNLGVPNSGINLSYSNAGTIGTLPLTLAPGRYVFFCNLDGHYLGGMHAVLEVSADG
jgi:hypothetical protein